MDEAVLQRKWRELAENKFEKLEKDVHNKVARKTEDGEGFICEDLLGDLGWFTSRDRFKKFVQGENNISMTSNVRYQLHESLRLSVGRRRPLTCRSPSVCGGAGMAETHDFVQKLNGAAISSEKDTRAKEEAQRELNDAAERARKAQEQTKQQIKEAKETYEAALRHRDDTSRAHEKARDDAVAAGKVDRQAREEAERKMEGLARHAQVLQKDTNRVMGMLHKVQEAAAKANLRAARDAEQARKDAQIAAEIERKSREEEQKMIQQLIKQVDMFKKQGDDAWREAKEAREAAAQIQAQATRTAVSMQNQRSNEGSYGYATECYGGRAYRDECYSGRAYRDGGGGGGRGGRPLTRWQKHQKQCAGLGLTREQVSKTYWKKQGRKKC